MNKNEHKLVKWLINVQLFFIIEWLLTEYAKFSV